MCDSFYDPIYGTSSVFELIDILSDKDLYKLTLDTLRAISTSLGLSGKSSNMTKARIIDKINLAIRIRLDIDVDPIPDLMYMVIDTETTLGFGTGRLLQLAYQIYKGSVLLHEKELYVLPCFKVTGSEIHGITEEELLVKGIPITDVIQQFNKDIKAYNIDVIIAHNLPFDWDVLTRESIQDNTPIEYYGKSYCTCRSTAILTYVQIKLNKTRATFPKLNDLYNIVFGTSDITKHRALDDVKMAAQAFFRLITLGIITTNDFKDNQY